MVLGYSCGTHARSFRLGRRCRLYTTDGEGRRLIGIDTEEGGGKSGWLEKLDAVQYEWGFDHTFMHISWTFGFFLMSILFTSSGWCHCFIFPIYCFVFSALKNVRFSLTNFDINWLSSGERAYYISLTLKKTLTNCHRISWSFKDVPSA